MTKKDTVYAEAGTWRHEMTGSQVTAIVGSFPRDAFVAAKGTAKFLRNANIVAKDFDIETYRDGYVLRLTRANGADLKKFERWAHTHDLLPNLKAERDHTEQAAWLQEMEARRLAEHRFTPLRGGEAKALITRLPWQAVDGFAPQKAKGRTDRGVKPVQVLVAAITDPETAFQAGEYLMEKGYITKAEFARLNAEINLALDNHEQNTEFRIAVPDAQVERFSKKFPEAGSIPPLAWSHRVSDNGVGANGAPHKNGTPSRR